MLASGRPPSLFHSRRKSTKCSRPKRSHQAQPLSKDGLHGSIRLPRLPSRVLNQHAVSWLSTTPKQRWQRLRPVHCLSTRCDAAHCWRTPSTCRGTPYVASETPCWCWELVRRCRQQLMFELEVAFQPRMTIFPVAELDLGCMCIEDAPQGPHEV